MNSRFNIVPAGEPDWPITILSKEGELAIVEMTTKTQHVGEIQGFRHPIVKGLKFRGGLDGIRLMEPDLVTTEDCEHHDIDQVAAILVLGVKHVARRR
jgi:hypothetical protein